MNVAGALTAALLSVGLAVQAQAPGPAVAPSPASSMASSPASACTHCRARLPTLDALRARLPADWQLGLEPEPVLGGEMLVVRAGPKDAPLLLLVHGLGQNGFTDWLPVLPQLARRWRVLAVDLPGFGHSSSPRAKLSPTNYARVLAQLLARESTGPVEVVGHSMGAAVALRLAAEHPSRVSGLVLVSAAGILQRTAYSKHAAGLPLLVENMPESLKEPVARLRDLGNLLVERLFGQTVDPTEVLRANEPLWGLVLRDRNNVNAALALVDEDYSAAVHTLAQPVRLIWGEVDAIAPLRTGELLARRLPRAQLATLPGIGHVPMAQATNAFLALLEQALRSTPGLRRDPTPPAAATDPAPDLHCRGEVDRRYSGRYREVRLDGCLAVQLVDLSAERIVVRDAIVQMTGVTVRSADVALDITNSELIATASDFAGRVAIRSDASRLDLAGVRLQAAGFAVQVLRRSRLVASVSAIRDAFYSGWWHEDRELEGELLDPLAPRRVLAPPAPAGTPTRP
jgi:pimeloyl-ACP methyl ester carboxylesterase